MKNEVTRLPGVNVRSQQGEMMTNSSCGSVSTLLWVPTAGLPGVFLPLAVTGLSRRQLTFASEAQVVEVERRKKPFVSGFPYTHKQYWKQIPRQFLLSQRFSLCIFPQDPPGCLGRPVRWGKDYFPSLGS